MVTSALPRSQRGVIEFPGMAGLAFLDTQYGRVSLTIHHNIRAAQTVWKSLEISDSASVTQAQSYESARAWYEKISMPLGAEPLIAIGRSETGQTLFLLPFEIVRRFGLRTLQWVGQSAANYNMGIYDRQFAQTINKSDMKALLKSIADTIDGLSLADFRNQPETWEDIPNPMMKLDHQKAPNSGFATLLDPDFETFYRNRFSGKTRNSLRRKERKLGDLGKLSYGWAKTPEECCTLLATYFEQKATWFTKQGIADPFSSPQHRAYFKQLALLPEGTLGRLELGYLKVGETVAATYNGSIVNGRFHLLLSSIALAETDKMSPGILLLRHQVQDMCRRGCHRYDLGAGLARHKSEWADDEIQLFDTFMAFDELGYAIKLLLSLTTTAKRRIKNTPALWAIARSMRSMLMKLQP